MLTLIRRPEKAGMAYRLGIDLGTTNTVAAVAVDGAPVEMVGLGVQRRRCGRCSSSPMTTGCWWVMRRRSRGRADPSRLIIDPRRQLGADVPLVIGGSEVTAEEATAAVLGFVRRSGHRAAGRAAHRDGGQLSGPMGRVPAGVLRPGDRGRRPRPGTPLHRGRSRRRHVRGPQVAWRRSASRGLRPRRRVLRGDRAGEDADRCTAFGQRRRRAPVRGRLRRGDLPARAGRTR